MTRFLVIQNVASVTKTTESSIKGAQVRFCCEEDGPDKS